MVLYNWKLKHVIIWTSYVFWYAYDVKVFYWIVSQIKSFIVRYEKL